MELTLGVGATTPGSDVVGATGVLPTPGALSVGNSTGGLSLGYTAALEGEGHAAWGPAAEQTNALSEAADDGGGAAQLSKWGLMPGADDTLDLNLTDQGTSTTKSIRYSFQAFRAGSLFQEPVEVLPPTLGVAFMQGSQ